MEVIKSKENKYIKHICKLVQSKSYRQQESLFVIEGIRLCYDAFISKANVQNLLVSESAYTKYKDEFSKMFLTLQDEMILISDDLALKISDTKTPQGIFMVCKMLDNLSSADKINNDGYYLCLVNLQDPGNIGTVIRTAEALKLSGIILSKDCCDIFSPKVIRSTMGSLFRIPIYISDDIESDTDFFNNKGFETYATVIDNNALNIGKIQFSNPSIVYIGNEGNGLDSRIINKCKHKATIPMAGNAESLNAAIAASIVMWEMIKNI